MVGNLSGYVTGTVPVVQFSSVQFSSKTPGRAGTHETDTRTSSEPTSKPTPPTDSRASVDTGGSPVKRDNLFFSHRPSASIARTVRDIREPPAPEGDHGPSCQGVGQLRVRVDPRRLPRRACIRRRGRWSFVGIIRRRRDSDATGVWSTRVSRHTARSTIRGRRVYGRRFTIRLP